MQLKQIVLGKEYFGDVTRLHQIAHRFSNEVLRFFTGLSGPFGSQILFSGKQGRFKELFLMDMDGSNIRQLTEDRGLAISPDWNPSGTLLVYTGYRNRAPDLYLLEPFTRKFKQITRGANLEVGAKFSNDWF